MRATWSLSPGSSWMSRFAAVLVECHVVGLVEPDRLGTVEQELERAAGLGIVDVGERQPPEPATVTGGRRPDAAFGRDEVEGVAVAGIERAVLDPVQRQTLGCRLGVLVGAGLVPPDLGEIEGDLAGRAGRDGGTDAGVAEGSAADADHEVGPVGEAGPSKSSPVACFVPWYTQSWPAAAVLVADHDGGVGVVLGRQVVLPR